MIAATSEDVNEDVAAVIETATKASRPTERSDIPYEINGFKNPKFARTDLVNSTKAANVNAPAKTEVPASIAEVAKELKTFNLIQTTEVPSELDVAGSKSDKEGGNPTE